MGKAGYCSPVHWLLIHSTLNTTAPLTDQSGLLTPDFFLSGTVILTKQYIMLMTFTLEEINLNSFLKLDWTKNFTWGRTVTVLDLRHVLWRKSVPWSLVPPPPHWDTRTLQPTQSNIVMIQPKNIYISWHLDLKVVGLSDRPKTKQFNLQNQV